MVVHSTLLSFTFPASAVVNPVESQTLEQEINTHLNNYGLKQVYNFKSDLDPGQGLMCLYLDARNGCHATLRGYTDGVVTLDLQETVSKESDFVFSSQAVQDIEDFFNEKLKTLKSESLPPVKRGADVDIYWPTVDRRLVEYDIDEKLYEVDSKYQNIKIYHAPSFGNMLVLDNDINLAESDLSYTRSLMHHGIVDYTDKTVLILGGGDGGLLNEIRKEKPKMITMVDIDEMVLNAAKKYLRGICDNSLDNLTGENYEVIVGDAVALLKQYCEEGRKFDVVLYDITAIPVTKEAEGDEWDFWRNSYNLGLKVLAPNGRYLSHANAMLARRAIELFEDQLTKLDIPVEWKKTHTFVPSFHEVWTFYEMWAKSSGAGGDN